MFEWIKVNLFFAGMAVFAAALLAFGLLITEALGIDQSTRRAVIGVWCVAILVIEFYAFRALWRLFSKP